MKNFSLMFFDVQYIFCKSTFVAYTAEISKVFSVSKWEIYIIENIRIYHSCFTYMILDSGTLTH